MLKDDRSNSLTHATNGCHPADGRSDSLTQATNDLLPAGTLSPAGCNVWVSEIVQVEQQQQQEDKTRKKKSLHGSKEAEDGHAMLDNYLSAMADGGLDQLCSYIDGGTQALTPSPQGKVFAALEESDSLPAETPSISGCNAYLSEIVQVMNQVEQQQQQQEDTMRKKSFHGTKEAKDGHAMLDEQENVDPCLTTAGPRVTCSRHGCGPLPEGRFLKDDSSSCPQKGTAARQPSNTAERRQLRPRKRRRYYEDDAIPDDDTIPGDDDNVIPRDDDFLCEYVCVCVCVCVCVYLPSCI